MSAIISESYHVEATDPGDIVIVVKAPGGGNIRFPVKALTVDKTIDITPEYGTGSHLPYQLTPGKIGFSGTFRIGTFVGQGASEEVQGGNLRLPGENKEDLVKALTDQDDEGLPLYFDIEIHDRARGSGENSYGEIRELIEAYRYCMLSGDGIDIGEPGTTVTRAYPFVAMRREPK